MRIQPFSPAALRSIKACPARLNIWEGSVRSGKTVASLVAWIAAVAQAPEGAGLLMAGKTERTLQRNILDPLRELVGEQRYRQNKGEGLVWLCGRKIYLVGANDERSEDKIRGLTLYAAYGDELTIWPASFFRMLLSRLSEPGARLFGTTNPDSPAHWLKTDYLDRQEDLDINVHHFALADNPALSQDYIANLQNEYTGLWRKRYIDGLWCAADGAVYDVFDPDVHVTANIDNVTRYYVGCDYGTTNPTVYLLAGVCKDHIHILQEYRYDSKANGGRTKTDVEYAEDLKAFVGNIMPSAILIDPSAASYITQCYQSGIRNIATADNTVLDGIRRVTSLFSAKRLLIDPGCTGLIREIEGYCWDSKAQNKGNDQPVKRDDHGPDALRYIINSTRSTWEPWLRN